MDAPTPLAPLPTSDAGPPGEARSGATTGRSAGSGAGPGELTPFELRTLKRVKALVQGFTLLGLATAVGGLAVALVWRHLLGTGALIGIGGGLLVAAFAVLIWLARCPVCGSGVGAQFDVFCTHCGARLQPGSGSPPRDEGGGP